MPPLFGFHVLIDAGDDAPSRKDRAHVLVHLLLRTTPSTRMQRVKSTHGKFSQIPQSPSPAIPECEAHPTTAGIALAAEIHQQALRLTVSAQL